MEWINVKDRLPRYGANVEFYNVDETEITEGQYVEQAYCMLGPPMGSIRDTFIDDYNRLPCDATHWREI